MPIIEFKRKKPATPTSNDKEVKLHSKTYSGSAFESMLHRYIGDLNRLSTIEHHLNVDLPLMTEKSQHSIDTAITYTVNCIIAAELAEAHTHLEELNTPEYQEARESAYTAMLAFYEWRANLNAQYYCFTFDMGDTMMQIVYAVDINGLYIKNVFTPKHSLYSMVADALDKAGLPEIELGL